MNLRTSEIVLKNVSSSDVTITAGRTGWEWCNFPAYWQIVEAPDDADPTTLDVVLSPGETYAFLPYYNTSGVRPFDAEGGELGIYTATGSFTTPELLEAFISWNNAMQAREPTAVLAGKWTLNDRIIIDEGDGGFVITGEADRASGYTSVPARCLAAPPNQ